MVRVAQLVKCITYIRTQNKSILGTFLDMTWRKLSIMTFHGFCWIVRRRVSHVPYFKYRYWYGVSNMVASVVLSIYQRRNTRAYQSLINFRPRSIEFWRLYFYLNGPQLRPSIRVSNQCQVPHTCSRQQDHQRVQLMTFRLFGAKSLSEHMKTYFQVGYQEGTSVNIEAKCSNVCISVWM